MFPGVDKRGEEELVKLYQIYKLNEKCEGFIRLRI